MAATQAMWRHHFDLLDFFWTSSLTIAVSLWSFIPLFLLQFWPWHQSTSYSLKSTRSWKNAILKFVQKIHSPNIRTAFVMRSAKDGDKYLDGWSCIQLRVLDPLSIGSGLWLSSNIVEIFQWLTETASPLFWWTFLQSEKQKVTHHLMSGTVVLFMSSPDI